MDLIVVQGEMRLAAPAAAAWGRLVADVKAETGVALTISSPGGAYRSDEMVLDMWRNPAEYGATKGTAKPRSLGGPGSVHENGLCVDIWNWAALGTPDLDHYAARHGFRRTIAAERWHYQHNGVAPAGGPVAPFDPRRRRRTMMLFHIDNTGPDRKTYPYIFWLVAENGARAQFVGSTEFANSVAGQLGNSIKTDMAFLDVICKRLADSQPHVAAVGSGVVDLSPVVAAIGELPAEIDRYADGKKQS